MEKLKHYEIKWIPLSELKWGEDTLNRKLSKSLARDVARAISKTGLVVPVICNSNLEVVDGQHRCQAVLELWGASAEVPVIVDDELAKLTLLLNTEKADNLTDILEKVRKLLDSTTNKSIPFLDWSAELGVPLWSVLLQDVPVKWKSLHRDNLKIFEPDALITLSEVLELNKQTSEILPAYENILRKTTESDFEKSRAMNSIVQSQLKEHFGLKRGHRLMLEQFDEWKNTLIQKAMEVAGRWNF